MHDRVFLIFVANQTAEEAANVMKWSGGKKGVPIYRDYTVAMFGKEGLKKMNLYVALCGGWFFVSRHVSQRDWLERELNL